MSEGEAVSLAMRRAKIQAQTTHHTNGAVHAEADGRITLECSCGELMTNGPTWSIDEHIRMHRAEARYLALAAVASPDMPRLITSVTCRTHEGC